jgi:nitrite reductase/ring-hydroxylating ferredoxin subunit/uncharacterized membrane protein
VFGLRIVDAVARQDWLGRLSESTQRAVQTLFEAGGSAGRQAADILHGTPLGHPLHPVLTDIPVGAWTAAIVLDALEATAGREDLAPGADVAIGVGLAGALAAAPTGLTDWKELDTKPLRIGMLHGMLNLGATTLYGASLLLRRNGARAAGRNCAFAGYALMLAAAYLGGDLVYRDQIGVSHANPVWTSLKWAAALPDSELPEGGMRRVRVGDRQIMLARQAGRIYALEAACSHLGGPLDDGALEDGCVVCPWHGSRFELATGEPIDGPAAIPQPCFETRVRDGQIEVRAGQ